MYILICVVYIYIKWQVSKVTYVLSNCLAGKIWECFFCRITNSFNGINKEDEIF